jgi:hypothetical protein
MTKLNDNLSSLLDVEPIKNNEFELVETEDEKELQVSETPQNDIEEDTDFARKNIKDLIENGKSAIKDLLHVAKESEAPRAYEVVATLLKNIAELNKDLLELQKRKKDLSPTKFKNQNISVDKAIVFTGSTTELINLIKQQKDA